MKLIEIKYKTGEIMYTHSDINNKKSIHYIDHFTRVSRRECLAFAQVINKPKIVKDFYNNWVSELGDRDDRTNMEAIATWVGNQRDILIAKNKKRRIRLLRSRFKLTIENWLKGYLAIGLKKV